MRPSSYCLGFVILISVSCIAQKPYPQPPGGGSFFLRGNPAGLMDLLDLNLSIGGEYYLNKQLSVSMDAGWIFYSDYFSNIKNTSGFLIRPGLRRYWGASGFYTEAQLHFKKVSYRVEDWVGRGIVNGTPAYEQLTTFYYRKKVTGLNILAGKKFPLSRSQKWWLECFMGLGIKYKTREMPQDPGSEYTLPPSFLTTPFNRPYQWLPAFPAGLRLVYKL